MSKYAVQASKIKGPLGKWAPTAIGLMSIPFIIHPIDRLMDYVMDETYRKYVK
jgi:fission process protein 1